MNGNDVDEFECETSFMPETPQTRQHFFLFLWFPRFIGCVNEWQAFFLEFFVEPRHEFETRLPPGSLAASRRGFAFCVADPIGSAHESTRIGTNGESEALRRFREGARARRSSPLQRFVAIGVNSSLWFSAQW
jgi:hypothetical protein